MKISEKNEKYETYENPNFTVNVVCKVIIVQVILEDYECKTVIEVMYG